MAELRAIGRDGHMGQMWTAPSGNVYIRVARNLWAHQCALWETAQVAERESP